jgi:hypothetical protein
VRVLPGSIEGGKTYTYIHTVYHPSWIHTHTKTHTYTWLTEWHESATALIQASNEGS